MRLSQFPLSARSLKPVHSVGLFYGLFYSIPHLLLLLSDSGIVDDLFLPSPEFFYQLGSPSGLRPSEVECHVDYWKNARRTLVGS